MKKVKLDKKYIVVTGLILDELENNVNEKISEGYIPLGGVCRSAGIFYQALTKVTNG